MQNEEKAQLYKGTLKSPSGTKLTATSTGEIVETIRTDQKIANQVKLLRKVMRVDQSAYKRQKTALPFFIGARFQDGIRRMEKLDAIFSFVIDIDHCFQDLPFDRELPDELKKDPRVHLMFRSPSGQGLKVMYMLDRPLESPKIFTDFYQTFVYRFSQHYKLEEFVDTVTSDVTRVCFFSHDLNLWYNPESVPVEVDSYIDRKDYGKKEEQIEKIQEASAEKRGKKKSKSQDGRPNKEQYREILQKLGSRKIRDPMPQPRVPGQLNYVLEVLQDQVLKYGFEITDITNISYGKKVKINHGELWAEINIFYGKKGFSVVLTPKKGSDPELGKVAERLAGEAIAQYRLSQQMTSIQISEKTFGNHN